MALNKLHLLLGLLLMTLSGCKEIHYYGFKNVEQDLFEGEFVIEVKGVYSEIYELDGKQVTDWSYPYFLTFSFFVPNGNEILSLEIRDIELIGEVGGSRPTLKNLQTDNVRVYDDRSLLRISSEQLTAEAFSYENYVLNATVVIHKKENIFEETKITARLETDYRTDIPVEG